MEMSHHPNLHSQVPKFGNWDDDNVPYTTYFENARKEKAGIKMNPNDPEENREAFMFMKGHQGKNKNFQPVQIPHEIGPKKSSSVNKHSSTVEERRRKSDVSKNNGEVYVHQKSGRHPRSIKSESGSEKSNSDHSLLQSKHRRENSSQRKVRVGRNSFSSSGSGQSKRTGIYQFDHGDKQQQHQRTASSVPEFGAWDETDPASGEGFTIIFNKVKEEKEAPPISSKYPSNVPTTPQPNKFSDYHQSKPRCPSSWFSKICCGLYSR